MNQPMPDTPPVTVAQLRAQIEHHRQWWPANSLCTAESAVQSLERLVAADSADVPGILGELRAEDPS